MKELITNMIFLTLGVVILTIELVFQFNDILGCSLASLGIILIGIGLVYKSKKPIKFLITSINFNTAQKVEECL